MAVIETRNNGPLIVSSTYWGSEFEQQGFLYLSSNAGAFRLLLPANRENLLPEMRTAKTVVISLGLLTVDPGRGNQHFEIMFDDDSSEPFCVHMGLPQADRIPADTDAGKQFRFTVWTGPKGDDGPKIAYQTQCWFRLVSEIPCIMPWQGSN